MRRCFHGIEFHRFASPFNSFIDSQLNALNIITPSIKVEVTIFRRTQTDELTWAPTTNHWTDHRSSSHCYTHAPRGAGWSFSGDAANDSFFCAWRWCRIPPTGLRSVLMNIRTHSYRGWNRATRDNSDGKWSNRNIGNISDNLSDRRTSRLALLRRSFLQTKGKQKTRTVENGETDVDELSICSYGIELCERWCYLK
jgi:hypothetical protein